MSLSFSNPAAFWLLLLVPVLVVLKVIADARARRAVTRLASPRLLRSLLTSHGRRRAWVVFSLELLALVFFAAALARPQYGTVSEESQGSGRSLIIAVDTSRSMLARDVLPNRLERAKLAAEDLVKKLRKDRIGLMPFAGTAFMYAPITPDTDAVLESIQSIDADIMPRGGSNIARAIDLAVATFKKSDLSGQQAMVLFSDGEELEGEAIAAARRARDAKLSIICVAVGTPAGELVPDPISPDGYYRDHGKPVLTRLHKEVLVKIADITGGLYLPLDGKGISDSRIDVILQKLQRSAMKSKTIETAVDRYRWPLAAGLISLVAAFLTGIVRRHRATVSDSALTAATVAAMILIASPSPMQAQEGTPPPAEDLNRPAAEATAKPARNNERPPADPPKEGDPWIFYKEGDWKNSVFNFDRAVAKAKDDADIDRLQMGRGVAAFKGKEYDIAIDAFGAALASDDLAVREKAHYNLGNTIYEHARAFEAERAKSKKSKKLTLKYLDSVIRQLENSLEHYQETLILNKDHAEAKKNHELVAELVKKLRDIRKEQAQQEGKGKGKGQGKSKSKGKGKGKGQGQGEGEGEGPDGEEDGAGDKEEGDKEGNGDKEGEGKGDKEGEGKDGEGDKKGEDGKGGDESNEEFDGKLGTGGGTGGEPEEKEGENKDSDGDETGTGTFSRSQAIQKLKSLSEELGARRRTGSVKERRPAKDW